MKGRIAFLLCFCALLTAGCAAGQAENTPIPPASINSSPIPSKPEEEKPEPTQEDALVPGTISRRPDTGTEYTASWQNSRGLDDLLTPDETGCLDLRCADLRKADLSQSGTLLLNASFDDQTQWPDAMPQGADLEKLAELGKDPGLGVHVLHEQGITGKGVGIAIIDQALLVEHQEYADRLRLYQEYHTASQDPASMHGPAVASIALGKTVGVAPEALLYYIADDLGSGTEGDFVRDMRFYAKDVERLTALNGTLPEGEKIRIISMSAGYMRDDLGAAEMDAAVSRARDAGIAVIMMNSRDPLMDSFVGMGWEPYGDPNDIANCRPGRFLEDYIYSGEYTGADGILVPMDRRTTAAQTGASEYAYYPSGGSSWKAPYVAGLFALACQVKPEITFEEFVQAAKETARPVSITHDGRDYPYGLVADPAALLERLRQ